jgi:hypothetical protein
MLAGMLYQGTCGEHSGSPQITPCLRPIMPVNRSDAASTPTHQVIDVRRGRLQAAACAVAGADSHTKTQTTMTPTEMILATPPAERIALTQLAHQEKKAPSTTWRWATKGVRGIRLPTAMVGSTRVTTRALFESWCEQLTATADDRPMSEEADAPLRNGEASRAERAEAELARLGLEA